MSSIATVRKLAAASVLAFAASASQAAVIDNWEYTLELNWITSSAVFSPGENRTGYPGATTVSNTLLSWGWQNGNYKNVDPNTGYNRSALEITTPTATGMIATNGSSVAANMFTHYNAPIYEVFPSLEKVQLSVTVNLGLPGFDSIYSVTQTFNVYFKETLNDGKQCAWGLCDNDIFAIVTVAPTLDDFSYAFNFGGIDYTFNYFETSDYLKPLSAAACSAAGIASGLACYGFTTPESMTTPVQFAFSITAVPEPETYAMLLAGLTMIGVVVRRRRNAIGR
ncbi:MAG: THxN family PEP-CTERM protein [Azoarcus sp.]|jgi:peptidoglycan hydrolase-like protein with peptidoglycan-binding domain|nr:THxN family PEP-CTERM protein [Azoarcus sp.]